MGMKMRRRQFGLLAAAATLSAALPAVAQPVLGVSELRRHRVVMQEFDISCAAAALCTLLNYQHGERLTEREIALAFIGREEYIENPDLVRLRQGFSLLELKRYVDGRGYEGVGFGQLTYEDLLPRAPMIVPITVFGYNHFVVFRGVMGSSVMLADPAFGNRTMHRDRFERSWIDFPELGHVGFMVERLDGLIPPNRLVPTADEFLVLRP